MVGLRARFKNNIAQLGADNAFGAETKSDLFKYTFPCTTSTYCHPSLLLLTDVFLICILRACLRGSNFASKTSFSMGFDWIAPPWNTKNNGIQLDIVGQ